MKPLSIAKRMDMKHNVLIRVIDVKTKEIVSEHLGHNAATNSMLEGIAHYLIGDGVLNQSSAMLSEYIPMYISLGTMGLLNQNSDVNGLPSGIGVQSYDGMKYSQLSDNQLEYINHSRTNTTISTSDKLSLRYRDYLEQAPGFGADGYEDGNMNNFRAYFGLGPEYKSTINPVVNCELVCDGYPRDRIAFRDIVPEYEAEKRKTIDVVFSAFVSTGALAKFRGNNNYIFITEAGLWSRRDHAKEFNALTSKPTGWDTTTVWKQYYEYDEVNNRYELLADSRTSRPTWQYGKFYSIDEEIGDNGLIAGYRISTPNENQHDMTDPANREILQRQIIRVGVNQVVQVIWKIQLGGIDQLGVPASAEIVWEGFVE